jgi:hypothetical protein
MTIDYNLATVSIDGNSLAGSYYALLQKRKQNKVNLPLPQNQSSGKPVCNLMLSFSNTNIIKATKD